ncbi:hypothetical protein PVAP13_2KG247332 [Panicum virgatum]|uniref:Uncharacterized protein n=1 Tax=Panicum virgatum TaxID=38727 RepID=A0A8T0W4M1_PANVG|nr:hypothetical protein PVAP13_2KG247332 [Panicum virgatum]
MAASTVSTTCLERRHGELGFRMASSRSNHGEGLVRISLFSKLMSISLGLDRLGSVSLLHRWQKDEEERRKKEEEDYARSNLQGCWSPFFGRLFSTCLLSVCLCGLLFDFFTRVWD